MGTLSGRRGGAHLPQFTGEKVQNYDRQRLDALRQMLAHRSRAPILLFY